jgi:hypothetical protein
LKNGFGKKSNFSVVVFHNKKRKKEGKAGKKVEEGERKKKGREDRKGKRNQPAGIAIDSL